MQTFVTHGLGLKKSGINSVVKVRMMANCLTWLSGFSHTSH